MRRSFHAEGELQPVYFPERELGEASKQERAGLMARRLTEVFKFGMATESFFTHTERNAPILGLDKDLNSRDESPEILLPADIAESVEEYLCPSHENRTRDRDDYKLHRAQKDDSEAGVPTFNIVGLKEFLNRKLKDKNSKLTCSRSQAASLAAFFTIFKVGELLRTFAVEKQFNENYASIFDREAFDRIQQIFPDTESLDLLEGELLVKALPILAPVMEDSVLLNSVYATESFSWKAKRRGLSRELIRKYFDTAERRKSCLEILRASALKDGSSTYLIEGFEFVFGDLTKEQFLGLFPNWFDAPSYVKHEFIKRFALVDPTEKIPEKVDVKRAEVTLAEAKPRVVYVHEAPILTERTVETKSEVAKQVNAYVDDLDDHDGVITDSGESLSNRGGVVDEGEATERIFVPLDKKPSEYFIPIRSGLEKMKQAETEEEKWRIFFTEVWPAILISLAHNTWSGEIAKDLTENLDSLNPEISGIIRELILLTGNISGNQEKINELTVKLRRSSALHAQGIYSHVEIIEREKQISADRRVKVKLLSGLSHKIDDTISETAGGKPVQILELGERMDRLDKDLPSLGFVYSGDGHGVVNKPVITEWANRRIIPELNNDTQYLVVEGRELHPITWLLRDLVRRDHPVNPTRRQMDVIYKKRFRSTGRHELHHLKQENEGRQLSRVEQETEAYLASMADVAHDDEPNDPFTDLAGVVHLLLSYKENPLSRLRDLSGIYEKASRKIILLISEQLQLPVDGAKLKENLKDALELFLEGVLEKCQTPADLQKLAKQILDLQMSPTPEAVAVVLKIDSKGAVLPDSTAVKSTGVRTFGSRTLPKVLLASLLTAVGLGMDSDNANNKDNLKDLETTTTIDNFVPEEPGQTEAVFFVPEEKEVKSKAVESPSWQHSKQEKMESLRQGIWGYAEIRLDEADDFLDQEMAIDRKKYSLLVGSLMSKFLRHLEQSGTIPKDQSAGDWSKHITKGKMASQVVEELDQAFGTEEIAKWLSGKLEVK